MDTQMHERKVTGKEKGQSFIAVNKILGVCDLHDYIRALGSQAEKRGKGFLGLLREIWMRRLQ